MQTTRRMLPGRMPGPARLFLQAVQPAVLAPRLALRLADPLHEQDPEEQQADQVTRTPEQAAGDVLVVQRRRRPGPAETRVPVLRYQLAGRHDRDAEEGVERQGEKRHEQPER